MTFIISAPVAEDQFPAESETSSSYATAGTHQTASTVSPRQVREYWRPGQRTVSHNQSGGALPNQRPVSNHGGGQLPSQRLVSPYHRGQDPPGTHGGPYTITTTVSNRDPYHTTTTIQLRTATRDPYNREPSPSPYTATYPDISAPATAYPATSTERAAYSVTSRMFQPTT